MPYLRQRSLTGIPASASFKIATIWLSVMRLLIVKLLCFSLKEILRVGCIILRGSYTGTGVFGSSGSSLHAKTFAINNEQVFVGSFNFDPRSARLNTEMGFLIESPALADALDEVFTNRITEASYEVKLDEKGKLYWVEKGEPDIIYHKEPNTSIFKRSLVRFLSWLPLDRML